MIFLASKGDGGANYSMTRNLQSQDCRLAIQIVPCLPVPCHPTVSALRRNTDAPRPPPRTLASLQPLPPPPTPPSRLSPHAPPQPCPVTWLDRGSFFTRCCPLLPVFLCSHRCPSFTPPPPPSPPAISVDGVPWCLMVRVRMGGALSLCAHLSSPRLSHSGRRDRDSAAACSRCHDGLHLLGDAKQAAALATLLDGAPRRRRRRPWRARAGSRQGGGYYPLHGERGSSAAAVVAGGAESDNLPASAVSVGTASTATTPPSIPRPVAVGGLCSPYCCCCNRSGYGRLV